MDVWQEHDDTVRPSGRWQVSSGGGLFPVWSRNSRELFYLSQGTTLTAVPIEPGASWVTGKPVPLFQTSQYAVSSGGGVIRNFDASADGQRFLFVKRSFSGPRITVVTNWFEEVARKVDEGDSR